MASRVQQDSFIDDSDETCPLCVEEFDLSDRNFRPCPCGYQVCQFCFNNIRSNMNGLCPACRRPYDEKTIEWKVVSPEEFKADLQKQARKKAELRQKEAQKKEVETTQRKHLAGLRVVQKNLVYVVGLNPRIREEDLLQTLRGEQYFGQYGKIIKIVVSKAKEGSHGTQPLGVYVTFARRQDAERCIAAVDATENGGRTLRAQFGTTKYCSAYLRNEQCMNKNCMFLHEAGEEKDSFTRQDLSSINVVSTQRPAQGNSSSPSAGGASSSQETSQAQPPQPQPPSQQPLQSTQAATSSTGQQSGKEGTPSPIDGGDGSALPSSASWATKGQQQRKSSRPTSVSNPSPQVSNASLAGPSRSTNKIASADEDTEPPQGASNSANVQSDSSSADQTPDHPNLSPSLLDSLLKSISSPDFKFVFSKSMFTPEEYEAIVRYPPFIDPHGGARRRAFKDAEEKERQKREEETVKALQMVPDVPIDEPSGSGSLQLGGEPEEHRLAAGSAGRSQGGSSSAAGRHIIQPPSQQAQGGNELGQNAAVTALSNLNISGRGLTPSQQQQLLYMRSGGSPGANFLDQLPHELVSQSQQQQQGAFQGQNQNQSQSASQGHTRHVSRFTFANDSSSASASVKPAANAKLMAQQSSMMPPGAGSSSQNSGQQQGQPSMGNHFFSSGMPGPPPGLKSAGTPPVSGGGMFSQGHGFANSMVGGVGMGGNLVNQENKSEMLRDMLRSRGAAGGSNHPQGIDMGKREFMFPSFSHQYPSTSTPAPAPGLQSSLYGPQSGVSQDSGHHKQKKKGKKHRHANTSSFGGSGIVDLADPSILQARMQQNASGSGQGLFGGQSQDNRDATPLEEATFSVDALVSEDVRGPSQTLQPADLPRPLPSSFPPGLSINQPRVLPSLVEEPPQPATESTDRKKKSLEPATPLPKPLTAGEQSLVSSPQSWLAKTEEGGKLQNAETGSISARKGEQKASITAAESSLQKKVQNESSRTTATGLPISASLPAKPLKAEASTTSRETSKRTPPGMLDIAGAKSALEQSAVSEQKARATPPPNENIVNPPSGSNTRTPTPASAGALPYRQTQPKTIRVVQTPKTETPPLDSATSASSMPVPGPVAAVNSIPSRKASVVSLNRPSTPASELISDNASVTSASLSRANSPGPSRAGSTPVRQISKSQLKKQRREAKQELEKKMAPDDGESKGAEEKEVAPIIGRKKKKAKPAGSVADDTAATPSRAVSPLPSPREKTKEKISDTGKSVPPAPANEPKKEPSRPEEKENRPDRATPMETMSPVNETSQSPIPTAASVIADLIASADLDPAKAEFFKSIPSINHRLDVTPADFSQLHRKITVTAEEQSKLANGEPVRFDYPGVFGNDTATDRSSVLISPSGYLLRGLTIAQQDRFLALEKTVSDSAGAGTFVPSRQGSDNGFFMVGGRVVQSGSMAPILSQQTVPPSSSMPSTPFSAEKATGGPSATTTTTTTGAGVESTNLSDAASKMRVDEALNYINQFVLPALPRTTSPSAGPGRATDQQPQPTASTNTTPTTNTAANQRSTPKSAPFADDTPTISPKAPDPAKYSPYATPPAGFGADVAGVVHGMVVGTADHNAIARLPPTGPITSSAAAAAALPYSHLAPPGQLPAVPLLSVEEAEAAMVAAKRETEAVEKRLAALWKRNKRFLGGGAGVGPGATRSGGMAGTVGGH
ncbi:MAG: S-methyl-5-thioadenosine phosphorylase [Chaenotheca gracillima]|nr:MAG: S-methyl-5-thioadenosine phosphorylase [Chaenotheca gracillima]